MEEQKTEQYVPPRMWHGSDVSFMRNIGRDVVDHAETSSPRRIATPKRQTYLSCPCDVSLARI